jgi:dipeptidyl aminopeptidase/acylaminoacyl peptidase
MATGSLVFVPEDSPASPVPVEAYPVDRGAPEVAVSADGKRLALVTADGSLLVRSLVTGEANSIAPAYTEDTDQRGAMAWSPDGEALAFVEAGKLFVWDKAGGRRELVTTPRVTDVAWSPDGLVIAYGRRGEDEKDLGLWAVEAFGGEPRRIAPPSGDIFAASWPVFSPDGRWIAFWQAWEGGSLCFVHPDGSGFRKGLDFGGGPTVWRADSSAVVYLALKDEMTVRGIYQCAPQGKPTQLTGLDVDQFDMLPTGEAVLLGPGERRGDRTLSMGVYCRAFDGISDVGWTRVLPGSYGQVRMSPRGKTMAVFIGTDEGPGKLYVGKWFGELQPVTEGITELLGWVQGPPAGGQL